MRIPSEIVLGPPYNLAQSIPEWFLGLESRFWSNFKNFSFCSLTHHHNKSNTNSTKIANIKLRKLVFFCLNTHFSKKTVHRPFLDPKWCQESIPTYFMTIRFIVEELFSFFHFVFTWKYAKKHKQQQKTANIRENRENMKNVTCDLCWKKTIYFCHTPPKRHFFFMRYIVFPCTVCLIYVWRCMLFRCLRMSVVWCFFCNTRTKNEKSIQWRNTTERVIIILFFHTKSAQYIMYVSYTM